MPVFHTHLPTGLQLNCPVGHPCSQAKIMVESIITSRTSILQNKYSKKDRRKTICTKFSYLISVFFRMNFHSLEFARPSLNFLCDEHTFQKLNLGEWEIVPQRKRTKLLKQLEAFHAILSTSPQLKRNGYCQHREKQNKAAQ